MVLPAGCSRSLEIIAGSCRQKAIISAVPRVWGTMVTIDLQLNNQYTARGVPCASILKTQLISFLVRGVLCTSILYLGPSILDLRLYTQLIYAQSIQLL